LVAAALSIASCGDCGGTPGKGPAREVERKPGTPPATAPSGAPPPGGSAEFVQALERAKLSLEPPSGFETVPIVESDRWAYQHAIKSFAAKLEIRYAALPPSEDHESMFAALVTGLDRGGELRGIGTFPYDSVREEFNANWGGALSFDVHQEFAPGYDRGLAVLIHRDGVGDGIFIGLFDELVGKVEWEWDRAFHALRFLEPVGALPSPHAETLAGTIWSCGDEGFVQMRFLKSTWTLIHVSAAHAVLGQIVPYESAYYAIAYDDATHFTATVFRVDNMEQGDRTPADPGPERYAFDRDDKRLELERVDGDAKWTCELIGEQ
jgi:hypothetical protein